MDSISAPDASTRHSSPPPTEERPAKLMRSESPERLPTRQVNSVSASLVPHISELTPVYDTRLHYIPYSGIGFLIIDAMWNNIITGFRSSGITTSVSPAEIKYVFSLLYFFHMWNIAEAYDSIPYGLHYAHSDLKQWFSRIIIPGPLVEFFTAFSAVKHPHEDAWYIPRIPKCQYAHISGLLEIPSAMRIPAIPAILRSIEHCKVDNTPYNVNFNSGAVHSAPAQPADTLHGYITRVPGLQQGLPHPTDAACHAQLRNHLNRYTFVYPNHPEMNWLAFTGIDLMSRDMGKFLQSWNRFCRFFESNKLLSSIPLHGCAAALVQITTTVETLHAIKCASVVGSSGMKISPPSLSLALAMMPNIVFGPTSFQMPELLTPSIGRVASTTPINAAADPRQHTGSTTTGSLWLFDHYTLFASQPLVRLDSWVFSFFNDRDY